MTGAPPVSHPVGRTSLLGALLIGIWAVGAGASVATLALASLRPASTWVGVILLIPVLLVALVLLRFWRAQRARLLSWDGGQWLLMAAGQAQQEAEQLAAVEVRLDLQRVLLLHGRRQERGPGTWLWAQQVGSDPVRWHGLRCALWSGDAAFARDRDSTSTGSA